MNKAWIATAIILATAVWAVYGWGLRAPLVFDDLSSLISNPSILHVWPLLGDAEHPGPLNPPKGGPMAGRPLANLTLALNYAADELDPLGYHLFNDIVHTLAALLLAAVVYRTLKLKYFHDEFNESALPLAAAAALLWAVHPLVSESVQYITQRTESMTGMFYLATLYGSLRYWSAAPGPERKGWLIFAGAACFLGMGCKEMMVSAPVVVLLFERTFITGSFVKSLRKSWPLYAGFLWGWALMAALMASAPHAVNTGFDMKDASPWAWWLMQCQVVWIYLKLAVWPWPLSLHYGMSVQHSLAAGWPWLAATAALGIATLILLWRRSAIGFALAWMLIILSPTLVVPMPTEVAAERRMYLPLAALISIAVVGGYYLSRRMIRRSQPARVLAMAATVSIIALLLAALSVRRIMQYDDLLTLWEVTVQTQPNDFFAHNNYGIVLQEHGRYTDAEKQFRLALQIRPQEARTHKNLGIALMNLHHLPGAVAEYQMALQIDPSLVDVYDNWGNALVNAGRAAEAIEKFQQGLRRAPSNVKMKNNLGIALAADGQLDNAIKEFQQATQQDPNFAWSFLNLAIAEGKAGRTQVAIDTAQHAIQLAQTQGDTAQAKQFQNWLNKYRLEHP